MRTALLLIGSAWGALLIAQPGDLDLFREPCIIPSDLRVDLSNDGIPDLLITGRSEGTDDVPSSSGMCTRVVQCMTGTQLLGRNDGAASDLPAVYGAHGKLVRSGPEEDLNLPAHHWFTGEVLALHWAYGSAMHAREVPQPDLRDTVFIALVRTIDERTLVAFLIEADQATRHVSVRVLAHTPYGTDLSW